MTKAAIPVVLTPNADLNRALSSMKQNMDQITGQVKGATRLVPLPPDATLPQIVTFLNQVAARLE